MDQGPDRDRRRRRYRVLEPTFDVDGGTPVDALEHELNVAADDGYRLAGVVPVRGVDGDGRVEDWVQALVLELDDDGR